MKNSVHLQVIRNVANLLDNKFKVFGFRFGLDPILGLIPGIGDFIPFVLGFYMIWIARKLELPAEKIGEMIKNIATDVFLGIIPVLGDFTDLVFRAHHKNLQIIEEFVRTQPPTYEGELIADKN